VTALRRESEGRGSEGQLRQNRYTEISPSSPRCSRQLAASWPLQGSLAGQETTHDIESERVLSHEYHRLHETSEDSVQGASLRGRLPCGQWLATHGRVDGIEDARAIDLRHPANGDRIAEIQHLAWVNEPKPRWSSRPLWEDRCGAQDPENADLRVERRSKGVPGPPG